MARIVGAAAREITGPAAIAAPSAPSPASVSRRVSESPAIRFPCRRSLCAIRYPVNAFSFRTAYHCPLIPPWRDLTRPPSPPASAGGKDSWLADARLPGGQLGGRPWWMELPQQRLAAVQALRRPHLFGAVVGLEGGNARRQHDPWLLGARVDVHVGFQRRGLIQRAYAHEAQLRQPAIIAPERCTAVRTAMNDMRTAAVRWLRIALRRAG